MYYIVWIEGLTCKTGEKVKSLTDSGVEYTTSMGEAMRVKSRDHGKMFDLLRYMGITETTFVKVTYAPKGTVYNFPQN